MITPNIYCNDKSVVDSLLKAIENAHTDSEIDKEKPLVSN